MEGKQGKDDLFDRLSVSTFSKLSTVITHYSPIHSTQKRFVVVSGWIESQKNDPGNDNASNQWFH